MCKKIITDESSSTIDLCLIVELDTIQNTFPRFKEKFKMIMSCCGHKKYPKTLIVQNTASKCFFEWFSGVSLTGNHGFDNRQYFYKRDSQGHYFLPEVQ